jgi:tripartite ATP-independent transporter DctM subunit
LTTSLIVIIFFVLLIVFLVLGIPLVFVIGGLATIGIYFCSGASSLGIVMSQVYNQMSSFTTIAIPCFIFLGTVLEKTGIAEEAFDLMYKIFGRVRGGLAVSSIIVCTIFGAMTGTAAASVVTMGLIALPAMLKHGYDKKMAVGSVAAGGTLGVIIPPSVLMVLYGLFTGESIGQMFAGGVFAGILISFLFCAYVLIRSAIQKDYAPAVPVEERAGFKEILYSSRGVIAPIILIIIVLGSIFGGIATPTEAAAVGCVGVLVIALIRRSLTWESFKNTCFRTLELSAMVVWIIFASAAFAAFFNKIGANEFITSFVLNMDASPYVILFVVIVLMIVLGMFLDPGAIIMLTIPIIQPIMVNLGFNSLWFGVLFVALMLIGYISPPFGFNLFYMKQIVPKHITMADIYKGVIPFSLLMIFACVIYIIFPGLITWLPGLIYGA